MTLSLAADFTYSTRTPHLIAFQPFCRAGGHVSHRLDRSVARLGVDPYQRVTRARYRHLVRHDMRRRSFGVNDRKAGKHTSGLLAGGEGTILKCGGRCWSFADECRVVECAASDVGDDVTLNETGQVWGYTVRIHDGDTRWGYTVGIHSGVWWIFSDGDLGCEGHSPDVRGVERSAQTLGCSCPCGSEEIF